MTKNVKWEDKKVHKEESEDEEEEIDEREGTKDESEDEEEESEDEEEEIDESEGTEDEIKDEEEDNGESEDGDENGGESEDEEEDNGESEDGEENGGESEDEEEEESEDEEDDNGESEDEEEESEDEDEDEEEKREDEDEEEKREDFNIQVKFVINKEKTKVLFAEAGSDFADVLLTFLLLPLGTIVKFLKNLNKGKARVIGSLNTLYNGLENLDSIHFLHKDAKSLLLNPKGLVSKHDWPKYESGLTDSTASFAISDDLRVMDGVEGSVMSTLDSLGIAFVDMDGAETRDVTFGSNKVKFVFLFLF